MGAVIGRTALPELAYYIILCVGLGTIAVVTLWLTAPRKLFERIRKS